MNSGKLLLGILIGAVAGAAAGLLLAPEKGSDIRDKISDLSEEYLDSISDKFDDLFENMSSKIGQLKNEASGFSGKK